MKLPLDNNNSSHDVMKWGLGKGHWNCFLILVAGVLFGFKLDSANYSLCHNIRIGILYVV